MSQEPEPLCSKTGCKYKRSIQNEFCGKHQLSIFERETAALNKKCCANSVRGCRSQLDLDYTHSRCDPCLSISREQDRSRRLQYAQKSINPETVTCTACGKEQCIEFYSGYKSKTTKTCKTCRENNKKQDVLRDNKHRNAVARKNAAKPENKAVKQAWIEQNPDKVLHKDRKHKAKMMLENAEEYKETNRVRAAEYRQSNPEKMREANNKKKTSQNDAYMICKNSASSKNLSFEYTKEYYFELIKHPCTYCGTIDERGFNGVDRLDCKKGYTLENGVSCCTMCNLMKASLSVCVFKKRIEHMCTHLGFIQGRLFTEVFPPSQGGSLRTVQKRATQKSLAFDLTPEFFDALHKNGCYLCGKQNDETSGHRNGTDRINNAGGYTQDNVRACCCQCNLMKKNFDENVFYEKLQQIWRHIQHSFMTQLLPQGRGCIPDGAADVPVECNGKAGEEADEHIVRAIYPHLNKVSKEENIQKKAEKEKVRMQLLAEKWPELCDNL